MIRHFTASGIVLSGERVLLIRHRKLGWWMCPGGHIEPDEDPVQAVLREVAEETGVACRVLAEDRFRHPAVTVLPSPFTIMVEDIPHDAHVGPHQHIDMIYVLAPVTTEAAPALAEVAACEWVLVSKVADLGTPPELPGLIELAAAYAGSLNLPPLAET